MNNSKFSRRCAAAVIAGAAMWGLGTAQAASTVALTGSTSPIASGDAFDVEIVGKDFVPVLGGGLDISFTSAVLELVSIKIDPSWSFYADTGKIDNGLGTVSGLSFNIFGSKSGDFPIAELHFKAKQPGMATIDLLPSDDFPFSTIDAVVPPVVFSEASVQVVPEPASWMTLAAGLGLLAFWSRSAVRRSVGGQPQS